MAICKRNNVSKKLPFGEVRCLVHRSMCQLGGFLLLFSLPLMAQGNSVPEETGKEITREVIIDTSKRLQTIEGWATPTNELIRQCCLHMVWKLGCYFRVLAVFP